MQRNVKITASDFHKLYKPSHCELRLWLFKNNPILQPELNAFEQLIIDLGLRHEKKHLDILKNHLDLSIGNMADRAIATRKQLEAVNGILYQPVLMIDTVIDGVTCELIGIPDFIIIEDSKITIRDVKLAKRITDKAHPEILYQIQFYGLIFSMLTNKTVNKLEILAGDNSVVHINLDEQKIRIKLSEVINIIQRPNAPESVVGFSKCNGCLYNKQCWDEAIAKSDIALVPGIDQSLTLTLREKGIYNFKSLLANFDIPSLEELKRPWGDKFQKVGKKAAEILRNAKALNDATEIIIKSIDMPKYDNFVMFDLEGMPPYFDEIEKIYLWGMQIYGKSPSKYIAAVAGFGNDGDREGWQQFLIEAEKIFAKYGDIPWIHWSSYEKTKINLYKERFGDFNGIADRVLKNLLDLLPITQASMALPIYSYSLKVIEKYLGFVRTQDEYGGSWSIAKYIEAVETFDEKLRNNIISEVLKYNEEDLMATWVVTEWLLSRCHDN